MTSQDLKIIIIRYLSSGLPEAEWPVAVPAFLNGIQIAAQLLQHFGAELHLTPQRMQEAAEELASEFGIERKEMPPLESEGGAL